MSHHTFTEAEIQERLWSAIDHEHTGMLGLAHDAAQLQPMTAFVERQTSRIWFFTYRDSDLAQAIDGVAQGAFVFQSKGLQASVTGALRQAHDRDRIEEYWNPHVAAWFPKGKEDPRLTLMCLDVSRAAVWVSDTGPMKYAFEVVRANVTKTTPDLGEKRTLSFS